MQSGGEATSRDGSAGLNVCGRMKRHVTDVMIRSDRISEKSASCEAGREFPLT